MYNATELARLARIYALSYLWDSSGQAGPERKIYELPRASSIHLVADDYIKPKLMGDKDPGWVVKRKAFNEYEDREDYPTAIMLDDVGALSTPSIMKMIDDLVSVRAKFVINLSGVIEVRKIPPAPIAAPDRDILVTALKMYSEAVRCWSTERSENAAALAKKIAAGEVVV